MIIKTHQRDETSLDIFTLRGETSKNPTYG
jgi:hypothetical protein